MIIVNILGHGQFTVHPDKLGELLRWLEKNSMNLQVNKRPLNDNQTLLNE